MLRKKVTFTNDTIDTKETIKCNSCYHRNITPKIKEMESCLFCGYSICIDCIKFGLICRKCYFLDFEM